MDNSSRFYIKLSSILCCWTPLNFNMAHLLFYPSIHLRFIVFVLTSCLCYLDITFLELIFMELLFHSRLKYLQTMCGILRQKCASELLLQAILLASESFCASLPTKNSAVHFRLAQYSAYYWLLHPFHFPLMERMTSTYTTIGSKVFVVSDSQPNKLLLYKDVS